jgi:hypothetical protein
LSLMILTKKKLKLDEIILTALKNIIGLRRRLHASPQPWLPL